MSDPIITCAFALDRLHLKQEGWRPEAIERALKAAGVPSNVNIINARTAISAYEYATSGNATEGQSDE